MKDCLSMYPHNGNCIMRDRKAQKNFSWIYTPKIYYFLICSDFFMEVCSKCTASYFIPKSNLENLIFQYPIA